VLQQLGDGTYGRVWKAVNRETNAVVRRWKSSSCIPCIGLLFAGLSSVIPCGIVRLFFPFAWQSTWVKIMCNNTVQRVRGLGIDQDLPARHTAQPCRSYLINTSSAPWMQVAMQERSLPGSMHDCSSTLADLSAQVAISID
jgi:hypothetical protein